MVWWCRENRVNILHSATHFMRRSFYTIAAPVVISLFLVASPLRWYANPWLVLPLFVAPALAGALFSVEDELTDWTGFIMFFTLLSLLTCYFELGFSYLPVIWCISCLLPRLIFLRSSKTSTCLVVRRAVRTRTVRTRTVVLYISLVERRYFWDLLCPYYWLLSCCFLHLISSCR